MIVPIGCMIGNPLFEPLTRMCRTVPLDASAGFVQGHCSSHSGTNLQNSLFTFEQSCDRIDLRSSTKLKHSLQGKALNKVWRKLFERSSDYDQLKKPQSGANVADQRGKPQPNAT